jgi:hypothetical protein
MITDFFYTEQCVVLYREMQNLIFELQEWNKLQRQKFLMFIYRIYYHNWMNISTIYIYNKTSIKWTILTIKLHQEVGQAKDFSAPQYI